MTQNQEDCFLAAARLGSIAQAAKELYLSIQVVSTHIQNLERELGVSLFLRESNGVTLSEDGRRFHPVATAWVETYDSALRDIQNGYRDLSLKFSVGFSEWINPLEEICDAVMDFAREHDQTELTGLHGSNGMILRRLSGGELDVAIMCENLVVVTAELDLDVFASERLCLYVPPDCTAKTPEDVASELPQVDAVYGDWSPEEALELSRRMSGYLGLPASQRHTMPNLHSMIAWAETLPCSVLSDDRFGYLKDAPDLRRIPINAGSSMCCVWNKRNENPLLPEFVRHMKAHFGECTA